MKKHKFGTMNIVLSIIAIFLFIFIVVMIGIYCYTGAIPDTLCTCVFAICGGECGAMAWIKTAKERYQDRQYEIEDREYDNDDSVG